VSKLRVASVSDVRTASAIVGEEEMNCGVCRASPEDAEAALTWLRRGAKSSKNGLGVRWRIEKEMWGGGQPGKAEARDGDASGDSTSMTESRL